MINLIYDLNVKYDNMEENNRFLLFLFAIAIPLSITMTFNSVIGFIVMGFLFAFRVWIPVIHRKRKKNREV